MTDVETPDFFTDPALVDDPFPYFESLRAQCPVTRLEHHGGVVAVTGYEDAWEIWRDHATFSSCNSVTGPLPGLPVAVEGDDAGEVIDAHRGEMPMGEYLVANDPPTHTELRGLLMRLLTPKRVQEVEPSILERVDHQLDHALTFRDGRFEVLHDFAQPFALFVIADLLGMPQEDHRALAIHLGVEQPHSAVGVDPVGASLDPLAYLNDTFTAYVEERRREPRDDVLTKLATATYPDGSTPEVIDVVRTATFLFAAGQDTTARVITAALRFLGDDPDLQARVRAEPGLIADFLEEVLRLEGPVKTVSRMARVSTTVRGVEVPAGTTVCIFPHAVNRDPERFEAPDELRVERSNSREHVAFGRGIHSCPGGPLARVEARVALERLLARTIDLRIDEAEHGPPGDRRYRFDPTYVLRGVQKLHVEVDPA